jgi:hypothetical protein
MLNTRIVAVLALLVIIVMLSAGQALADGPIITDGLIGAWDFSTFDGTNLEDFSAFNRDLQLINGPTAGGGVCLDGDHTFDGVDDRMEATSSPIQGGTSYSISMLVSTDIVQTQKYVVFLGSGSNAVVWGYNGATYELYNGAFIAGSAIAVSDTDYHWVVWTSDGTTLRSYLDGVQVGTGTAAGLGTTPGVMIIGNVATVFWDGSFDELYMYSDALTADEVSAQPENCDAVPPEPPAGFDSVGVVVVLFFALLWLMLAGGGVFGRSSLFLFIAGLCGAFLAIEIFNRTGHVALATILWFLVLLTFLAALGAHRAGKD